MTTIFVCGGPKRACTSPGCTTHAPHSCTFDLGGRKAGQRCGRALCPDHVVEKNGRAYCAPHAQLLERRAAAD